MKPFRVLDAARPDLLVRGQCALAMMTKAPRAGQVKTRLVPPLTPDEAAELNKCFLRDTAAAILVACSEGLRPPNAYGIAVYTPVGAASAYVDILPSGFSLLPQRGERFGERLYFAAQDLFHYGFESVCLIDSDSPTVSAVNFTQAVKHLRPPGDRIVLGPCADGGYYLIGLKKPHREFFKQIDWSTERVLDQTLQRAAGLGLEARLLPTGYDVDDAASLHRLCSELLASSSQAGTGPNTREFLRKLSAQKKL
jgi:uncharacterized protein